MLHPPVPRQAPRELLPAPRFPVDEFLDAARGEDLQRPGHVQSRRAIDILDVARLARWAELWDEPLGEEDDVGIGPDCEVVVPVPAIPPDGLPNAQEKHIAVVARVPERHGEGGPRAPERCGLRAEDRRLAAAEDALALFGLPPQDGRLVG